MEIRVPAGVLHRSPRKLTEIYRAAIEIRRDGGALCYPDGEYLVLDGVSAAISYLSGSRGTGPMVDGPSPPRTVEHVERQIEAALSVMRGPPGDRADFAYGVFYTLRYAVGLDDDFTVLDVEDRRRTYRSVA